MKYIPKPTVIFDVNNPEHRQALCQFAITHKWDHSPYWFKTKGYGNTIAIILEELLQYLCKQELNTTQKDEEKAA